MSIICSCCYDVATHANQSTEDSLIYYPACSGHWNKNGWFKIEYSSASISPLANWVRSSIADDKGFGAFKKDYECTDCSEGEYVEYNKNYSHLYRFCNKHGTGILPRFSIALTRETPVDERKNLEVRVISDHDLVITKEMMDLYDIK